MKYWWETRHCLVTWLSGMARAMSLLAGLKSFAIWDKAGVKRVNTGWRILACSSQRSRHRLPENKMKAFLTDEGLKLSWNGGIVILTSSFDITENGVYPPNRRSAASSLETNLFFWTQLLKSWIMLCMQWINHNPLDNLRQNLLSYLVDSDLSNQKCYPPVEQLGPMSK